MIVFPEMLVEAARQAKMKVPADPENYDQKKYLHWHVFCAIQLCRSTRPGEHWDNAKIIAKLPVKRVMNITLAELLELGIH